MKKIILVGIVMLLLSIGLAAAGSVENDCTDTEPQCIDYELVCTHWNPGHTYCYHWQNQCVDWEEVCTDSTTSYGDVDADTVQGKDVVGYIGDNENAWLKDDIGNGGGMNERDIAFLLTGDSEFFKSNKFLMSVLDSKFCLKSQYESEYKELENRVTMIEQFLIEEFGFNPNDKELEVRAALRLGTAGNTICKNGICVTPK